MKASPILNLLGKIDITEVFKTKGDLRRWSAKRTIGGVLAITACNDIATNGMTWMAVALAGISVVPICLSFTEKCTSNPPSSPSKRRETSATFTSMQDPVLSPDTQEPKLNRRRKP